MLIPIGTNRPLRRTPFVTQALILLNACVFVAMLLAFRTDTMGPLSAVPRFGLIWDPAQPWRFLSYAFIHAGALHLGGNLLFLWVFGPSIEDRFGHLGFLLFYLAGAVLAGLAHVAVETTPVVGASGAIAAVTGAYMVLFPRTLVRTFVLFIIIGVWNIPALWYIGFAIARDFLLMNTAIGADDVARAAHLGGYLFGIALSLLLLATGLIPREDFDLFYLFRQSRRRREIRSATASAQRRIAPRPDLSPRAAQRIARAVTTEPSLPEEALRLRAQIAVRLKDDDLPGAAAIYTQLADSYADTPGAASLTRRHQLLIANHFFNQGDHPRAAAAYERFLATHAHDDEAANVRLMLGLVLARYLNQPARARAVIHEALPRLRNPDDQAFARHLLAELDAPTTPASSTTPL